MALSSEPDPGLDPELIELIEAAATRAAQTVAQIHRRRLVRQTFVASLVAAALVVLPVLLVVSHGNRTAARAHSRYNCVQFGHVANALGGFIRTDAELREKQRQLSLQSDVQRAFSKILKPSRLTQLENASRTDDKAATSYWQGVLLPRISGVAAANCNAAIR